MDELGRRVADGLFPEGGQEVFRAAAAARLAQNRPMNYLRLLWAVGRFDLRARLGDIRAPTLIVAGDLDTTVPMACKLELAQGIRGAQLQVFAGSRHVTPLDRNDEFNARLLTFLAEAERRAEVMHVPSHPGGRT
jgi:3-oxoadipate enol-lactonase